MTTENTRAEDERNDTAPDIPDATDDENDDDDIRDTDILFECPQCGKSMVIDYRGAGLTIPCVDCRSPVDVPIPEGMDLTDLDSSPADQGVQVIHMRELLADAQRKLYVQEGVIEGLKADIERANQRAEKSEKQFQEIRWESEVIQRAIEAMRKILDDKSAE